MSSSSQVPESWISAFCSLVGHEYFAEVSEDFIEDDFNLTGLQSQVPMYKEALEMILDVEPEDASEEEEEEEEEDEDEDEDDMNGDALTRAYRRADAATERRHLRMASDLSVIESSAEMLYGLIHQRFITSRPGIQQMAEKYDLGHFGNCPRVFCHGAKVLPVGCSDIPGQETVKLFCPSCLDVYSPPNSRFQTVDGAFFGTTFGCLFFMTFPDLEVSGQRPSFPIDPSASSPNQNHHQDKTARSSLSSSLTSQQPVIPPLVPESSTAHHDSSNSDWLGPSWPPKQPEIINGVTPKNLAPGLGPGSIYEPRIYGFRVSEFAKTGPRMKWLRSRPQDINELDECRIWARSQEIALRSQANPAAQQQQQQPPLSTTTNVAEMADSEMVDEDEDEEDEAAAEDAEMVEGSTSQGIDVPGAAAEKRRAAAANERGKQRMHGESGSVPSTANGGTPLVNGDARSPTVRVGDGG